MKKNKLNNFKRVLDDADSHKLLAIVATMHHERVHETFDNGALSLTEPLGGITSSRVRKVLG